MHVFWCISEKLNFKYRNQSRTNLEICFKKYLHILKDHPKAYKSKWFLHTFHAFKLPKASINSTTTYTPTPLHTYINIFIHDRLRAFPGFSFFINTRFLLLTVTQNGECQCNIYQMWCSNVKYKRNFICLK